MATKAWDYNAGRGTLDRLTFATTTSGYWANGVKIDGVKKTGLVGIVDFRGNPYFVNIFQNVNQYIYQKIDTPTTKGLPTFALYPNSIYGTKQRSAAFGSSAMAGMSAPVTNGIINTYGVAMTGSPDSIEAKLNLDALQRIAGRTYQGEASYAIKLSDSLAERGYSQTEIKAYLRATNEEERAFIRRVAEQRIKNALAGAFTQQQSGSGAGTGGGGTGGRENPLANQVPISAPELETRLVVRMPAGYLPPGNLSGITRPALYQTFTDKKGKVKSYTYEFDYVPSEVRYSGLGSEWVEIPRAENFPFVDWNRYQLMKVSMSWIVAYDRVEPGGARVHDGMFRSVDSNIKKLRAMAQRKYPVTVVNMDDLLSVQLKRSEISGLPRGMQFVITDVNVTAARRTTDPITGQATSPSKISVAQVEMTLQEIPIEGVQILSLPKLNIPFMPPAKPGAAGIPNIPEPGGIVLADPQKYVKPG